MSGVSDPGRGGGPAKSVREPFRFFDNRGKYLLFATTTSEKRKIAERAGLELEQLSPKPPALRIFQAGAGEGTLLNLALRHLHLRWPNAPFFVVVKENSAEFVRLAVRTLADRFREHPALVMVITNTRYTEAAAIDPDVGIGSDATHWREVALEGTSAYGFAAQLNREAGFINRAWQEMEDCAEEERTATRPSVLVLYRKDQSFALDRIVPRKTGAAWAYDLILAAQPYRSRLPAETKARCLLAPLARALAPGGRMLVVQSTGEDPGMEIVHEVWPDAAPFPTPRRSLLEALRRALGKDARGFRFPALSDDAAKFFYRLQLNPDELDSAIGTSTLLAAWNAATYVAQIDDARLTEAMSQDGYLRATQKVLQANDGLWFKNECLVVTRPKKRT